MEQTNNYIKSFARDISMTPCHHHQMQRKLIFDNDDMESLKRPG